MTAIPPHRRLLALLRPERRDILLIIFFSLVSGVLNLASPLAVDAVVNNITFGGEQQVFLQTLLIFSFALLVFLALLSLISATQHYVAELIQRRLFARLAADLSYRLPHLDVSVLERAKLPELVNRFLDVVTVQKSSATLLLDGINVLLAMVIGLLILAFYHPFLLAFNVFLTAGLLIVILFFQRRAVQTSIEESYAKHGLAGWFEQILFCPVLFKHPAASEYCHQRTEHGVHAWLTARRAHYRILIRQILGLLGLQALANGLLLATGGFLVLRGELTLGQLVAAELIVSAILASLVSLGKHVEAWYDALAATDKLGSLIDLQIEISSGDVKQVPDKALEISADDLAFGYTSSRPLASEVKFRILAGERIGLTGPIGVGTGTLLELFFGLRPALAGTLKLGGVDIRHWDLPSLREATVLVRHIEIFDGTVLDNLCMGRQLPLQEVQSTLDGVGLGPVINRLPEGLQTQLKPGGRPLSDSQRILLVVARALLARPRLLLIDKLLDGLDPKELQPLLSMILSREAPWTLMLATRDAKILGRCDRVLRIQHGKVIPEAAPLAHQPHRP
jgi:putative ABC transport system ATP-binding protein